MQVVMTKFVERLRSIVGAARVETDVAATLPYRSGFRFGSGAALAVVQPQSLVDMWRVVEACVEAEVIVIMQAANTGLTGGSTPNGDDYDRDIVIISTLAMDSIHVIDEGRQVVCLPGATLHALEAKLRPLGREPHSVIGSSCFGASVVGGVCNNSGGALVRRGPAFTQLALYAQRGEDGVLRLVNHLGIRLEGKPEDMLRQIEAGHFAPSDVALDVGHASDPDYDRHVRDIHSDRPARFNADPRRLKEAAGSAGHVIIFAVRLDTFPIESEARTFYIGTNDPAELTAIRRHMLTTFPTLPISAEYLHRDVFDLAAEYGKDSFVAIRLLGTSRLPQLARLQTRVNRMAARMGMKPGFSDRLLQRIAGWLPLHLPARMREWRARYEHHLLLKVAKDEAKATAAYLSSIFPSAAGDMFVCTAQEAEKAFLHRFVAAGAAVRYRTVHPETVEDIVALDIALPRNATDWMEILPPEIDAQIVRKLYYGHFFCHVFHQDYVVRKGCDPLELEHRMWALLDARRAEYPAEHNVGHLYPAKPALADFYRSLDPYNSFNPGVGQTSKKARWN